MRDSEAAAVLAPSRRLHRLRRVLSERQSSDDASELKCRAFFPAPPTTTRTTERGQTDRPLPNRTVHEIMTTKNSERITLPQTRPESQEGSDLPLNSGEEGRREVLEDDISRPLPSPSQSTIVLLFLQVEGAYLSAINAHHQSNADRRRSH